MSRARGVQPGQHGGAERGDHQAHPQDRLPHHRGPSGPARPRPPVRRPYEFLTDASWRRDFGDTARPLVPRYLRRGIRERIDPEGGVLIPFDEEQARAELEVVRSLRGGGRRHLPAALVAEPGARAAPGRPGARRAGRHSPSRSPRSDVSPLAREYPRASTTVIDLLMKLKYTEYTARLDADLRRVGLRRRVQLRRLLRHAACPPATPWSGPTASSSGARRPGPCRARASVSAIGRTELLCADVGGTSCDISLVLEGQPWVNSTFELEWDLVVNALSTEIVTWEPAVVRWSPSDGPVTSRWVPTAPGPIPARRATARAARGPP